jgi:hypothetical protein
MSNAITIPISDRVMRFVAEVATQTKQPYETVLANHLDATVPIELLPDQEILALSQSAFPQEQDDRLGELLALQRENQLSETNKQELNELMGLYEKGALRKAQASRVAVERGLCELSHF